MWTVSTLSLCSFPTHVLPVLSVRKRLCILCVPPKFHNLPSRGNIIMKWVMTKITPSKRSCIELIEQEVSACTTQYQHNTQSLLSPRPELVRNRVLSLSSHTSENCTFKKELSPKRAACTHTTASQHWLGLAQAPFATPGCSADASSSLSFFPFSL